MGTVTKGCPASVDVTRHTSCEGVCAAAESEVCLTNSDCSQGTCHPAKVPYDGTTLTTTLGVCY